MTYFFLGPPASGKGTQAGLLASALVIPAFSVGALLREQSRQRPDIAAILARGGVVPARVVLDIFHRLHGQYPNNLIIDGACRTADQVDAVAQIWDHEQAVFLFLDLDEAAIYERIRGRLDTSDNPRSDDIPVVIEQRLAEYRHHNQAILDRLADYRMTVCHFDASQTPDQIHAAILDRLASLPRHDTVIHPEKIDAPKSQESL